MRTKQEQSFNRILFAERLRSIRDKLKMTQLEMSFGVKRGRTSYHQWEGGEIAPPCDGLVNLIKFLKDKGVDVSSDYLLGLSEFQNESLEMKGRFKEMRNEVDLYKEKLEHVQNIASLLAKILVPKENGSLQL